MKHNYAQTSYALFAGYTYKTFRAGVEYNMQKNNGMINNHDFSGISVYTALQLNDKYSIFARYDYLRSEHFEVNRLTHGITIKTDSYLWQGLIIRQSRGVKLAPTCLGWSPYNKSNVIYFKNCIKY